MNKQELIATLSDATGETKATIGRVLDTLTTVIIGELRDGNEVAIDNLGKFSVTTRKARTVTSPLVGGSKEVPASRGAKFKPWKALKEALN